MPSTVLQTPDSSLSPSAGILKRRGHSLTLPKRHWRSYGNAPLPTGQEAMDEPFAAFPSWFLRITGSWPWR